MLDRKNNGRFLRTIYLRLWENGFNHDKESEKPAFKAKTRKIKSILSILAIRLQAQQASGTGESLLQLFG